MRTVSRVTKDWTRKCCSSCNCLDNVSSIFIISIFVNLTASLHHRKSFNAPVYLSTCTFVSVADLALSAGAGPWHTRVKMLSILRPRLFALFFHFFFYLDADDPVCTGCVSVLNSGRQPTTHTHALPLSSVVIVFSSKFSASLSTCCVSFLVKSKYLLPQLCVCCTDWTGRMQSEFLVEKKIS